MNIWTSGKAERVEFFYVLDGRDCLARGRKEEIDAAPFSQVVEPAVPLDSTVPHFLVRSAFWLREGEEAFGGGAGVGSVFFFFFFEEKKERKENERNEGEPTKFFPFFNFLFLLKLSPIYLDFCSMSIFFFFWISSFWFNLPKIRKDQLGLVFFFSLFCCYPQLLILFYFYFRRARGCLIFNFTMDPNRRTPLSINCMALLEFAFH